MLFRSKAVDGTFKFISHSVKEGKEEFWESTASDITANLFKKAIDPTASVFTSDDLANSIFSFAMGVSTHVGESSFDKLGDMKLDSTGTQLSSLVSADNTLINSPGGATISSSAPASVASKVMATTLAASVAITAIPTVSADLASMSSVQEAAEYLSNLGITDAAIQADLLKMQYSNQVTTATDITNMFASTAAGFQYTYEDVVKFTGTTATATANTNVTNSVNQNTLTVDEVKKLAADQGLTLTTEEAQKYAGQTNLDASGNVTDQTKVQAAQKITDVFDSQYVTRGEVETEFARLGYKLTTSGGQPENISQFIGKNNETGIMNQISKYVDDNTVSEQEVKDWFAAAGYTPTDAEVKSYVATNQRVDPTLIKSAVNTYADQRTVTRAEVIAALSNLGIDNATEADIARFVGQYDQNLLSGRLHDAAGIIQNNVTQGAIADAVTLKIGRAHV